MCGLGGNDQPRESIPALKVCTNVLCVETLHPRIEHIRLNAGKGCKRRFRGGGTVGAEVMSGGVRPEGIWRR